MMLYGTEAVALVNGGIHAEARHAVLKEGALTLEDYWMRRSARARFDLDGGIASLRPAADAMAPLLGWSAGGSRSSDRSLRRDSSDGTRAARSGRNERR